VMYSRSCFWLRFPPVLTERRTNPVHVTLSESYINLYSSEMNIIIGLLAVPLKYCSLHFPKYLSLLHLFMYPNIINIFQVKKF
jgi:hypothetical protein